MSQVAAAAATEPKSVFERPTVNGKFLYVGGEKFWVRGVSYGTFNLDSNGNEEFKPETVERDFAAMVENGFNVVRIYTVPPRWLLDVAQKNGLRVMVGLPWEQHIAFLDESGKAEEIEQRIRRYVRSCSGHPALFCYTIGNEVPSSIVRWHGRRRVEKFLKRLYRATKEEDPTALVTYVNFPTTEYLQLPFLDFVCFNVYLESQQPLEDYIARLHNLSSDRPLLMAEIGLDSRRNGEKKQADTLVWQISTVFKVGCCGIIIFAWTDEWFRGGYAIDNWDFGLTTRDRTPKPSLKAVKKAFEETPFPLKFDWPKISVVLCSYNGAATIRDTLEGLRKLDHPDFEVIVVNDGSTDSTPQIASEYPFRLINTENRGLSHARNTGTETAQGEIVAFIDDDAYPDTHWLKYLALKFSEDKYAGVGGPNLSPPKDGWLADAVANAPGPNHVLLSDKIAEHIPGCNMAFRKDALQAVGGFDEIFRVAGDDVDLCWRISESGFVIGFSPVAVVWHHRRGSVSKYWKQQVGYGKAEALLETKWPEKFNVLGQSKWLGHIYGKGFSLDFSALGSRIYQGVWGSAPFQSLYQSSNSLWSLTLMPEWYLVAALLALMTLLTIGWGPTIIFVSLTLLTIALPVAEAFLTASRARFSSDHNHRIQHFKLFAVTGFLHVLQPLARLKGRLSHGLTPWRRRGMKTKAQFLPVTVKLWREKWKDSMETLRELQTMLRKGGAAVKLGGEYDSWDFEVSSGLFGKARLQLATEEHGTGRQFLRFRIAPRYSRFAVALTAPFIIIFIMSWLAGSWVASIASGIIVILTISRAVTDTGFASGMLRESLKQFEVS